MLGGGGGGEGGEPGGSASMRRINKSEVGYSIARMASHRLDLKTSASVVSVRHEVTARPEVRSRPHSAPGRAKNTQKQAVYDLVQR